MVPFITFLLMAEEEISLTQNEHAQLPPSVAKSAPTASLCAKI